MRLRRILIGAALSCIAGAAAGAAPAGSPAIDRLLRALAQIERNYVEAVDLEALAASGVTAIRDRAGAEPTAFRACVDARHSPRSPGTEGAGTALVDALECTKAPPERFDLLVDSALQAMVDGLDPLSHYYGPADYRALLDLEDAGHVGLRLASRDGGFEIVGTDPATPARAAGLGPGEMLVAVGDTQLKGKSLEQATTLLRGPVGSEVVLTLAAPGRPGRELALIRVLPDDGMDLEAETRSGVLILHVHRLGRGLRAAVDRAIRDAPARPRAVLLDLRSNPGGLLDEAVWLADAFLDRGRIVESRGRGKRAQTYRSRKGQVLPPAPLVVLVDGDTAAGAEIVAAALQDNKRALVAGTLTYGAGTVQTLIPVDRDRAIRLTTSYEYRADGRRLQDAPVVPDCPLAESGEPAVAAAVAIALGDRSPCRPPPVPDRGSG